MKMLRSILNTTTYLRLCRTTSGNVGCHILNTSKCRRVKFYRRSLDRLQGTEMVMTQELIANMLGVPREGATQGALKLQNAGLIDYTHGRIRVLDRQGLEKRTCECYAVVKKEYERLLPDKLAA